MALELCCCGCGKDLSDSISEAVDIEDDRRDSEVKDGFQWPIVGIVCEACQLEIDEYLV